MEPQWKVLGGRQGRFMTLPASRSESEKTFEVSNEDYAAADPSGVDRPWYGR